MPYFGLSHWLSPTQPGATCNLNMKKTVLAVLMFTLIIMLGIAQYLFITKFYLAMPPLAHAILFLAEIIAFLISIHGLYAENAYCMIPLGILEIVRVISLSILIIYYIVQLFISNNRTDYHVPEFEEDRSQQGDVLEKKFIL
ncbi:hypothetical protein WR25_01314 [Diploscapter pachys]|uniref:MARVEL domain-containing protein n=1 Tax=Diploscapter pachys TaxID=2018661 RepID=A0A2A2KPK8_9BILA|nr:hypothetical protein WR25_01314 [Diploscapter pachys]